MNRHQEWHYIGKYRLKYIDRLALNQQVALIDQVENTTDDKADV